jgi:hypothetical protein
MIGVANPTSSLGGPLNADLDTLATALSAKLDELLKAAPPPGAVAANGGDRAQS